MEYKYYVHDDDGKILDKEFDNFPDAFDYAQDGLYTYIDRVSVVDEDDYENVWTWDDTRDREEAIRDVEALNAEISQVDEQVEVDVRADSPEEFRDFSRIVLGDNHEFFDSNFEDEKVPDAKAPDVEVIDTDFEPEFAKDDEPIVEDLREPDTDEINTMLDEWAKDDAKEYAEMSLDEFLAAGKDLGIKLSEGDYYKYDDYYSEYAYMNSEDEDAEYEDENLDEDTHAKYAKPEGDKVASYNNALKYAKQDNVPYIYGYMNATQNGKFFALDQPIKVVDGNMIIAEKEFRNKYKSAATIYAAYPDKNYVKESLEELNEANIFLHPKQAAKDIANGIKNRVKGWSIDNAVEEFSVICWKEGDKAVAETKKVKSYKDAAKYAEGWSKQSINGKAQIRVSKVNDEIKKALIKSDINIDPSNKESWYNLQVFVNGKSENVADNYKAFVNILDGINKMLKVKGKSEITADTQQDTDLDNQDTSTENNAEQNQDMHADDQESDLEQHSSEIDPAADLDNNENKPEDAGATEDETQTTSSKKGNYKLLYNNLSKFYTLSDGRKLSRNDVRELLKVFKKNGYLESLNLEDMADEDLDILFS